MGRTFADSRRWMAEGTRALATAVDSLTEEAYAEPTVLPGWTRKHVVAHVAANAGALGNLVHWAATGERTPMYSSPEQRAAEIESGAQRTGTELTAWFHESEETLEKTMSGLGEEQWQTEVVTAQGLTRTATDIPWMRAREVWIHAVDLGTGVTFTDLPGDFLEALVAEIRAKRGVDALPGGPLPGVAAWLAGRPHSLTGAPELGPWL